MVDRATEGGQRVLASVLTIVVAMVDTGPGAVFPDAAAARQEGLSVEWIARPRGVSAALFAERLAAAEGLVSWSGADPVRSRPGDPLQWRGRHAANGREVVVYFAPGKPAVCRIRRQRGGVSDMQWRAMRWCAAGLGIDLAEQRPPPLVSR